MCLSLYMFYVNFENSATVVLKHVFHNGIKEQKAPPHEMLDCLKSVVAKKAQVD